MGWHKHHHRRMDWKSKILILIIILAFFGYYIGALKIDTDKINLGTFNITKIEKPMLNKFVGKWQTQQGFIYETITMDFLRDGKGSIVTPLVSNTFTYKIIDENKIEIKEGDSNPRIWTYEFIDDVLILGKEGREYKMAYTKID